MTLERLIASACLIVAALLLLWAASWEPRRPEPVPSTPTATLIPAPYWATMQTAPTVTPRIVPTRAR